MPLYEYQCESCGARFELIRKFSDPPVETCPTCQGPVRKLVSSPAFQFKGSGWYVTDYARKREAAGKSKAGESSEASSAGGAAPDAKTPASSDKASAPTPPSKDK
jgi:putative FmdB family regulatory protein